MSHKSERTNATIRRKSRILPSEDELVSDSETYIRELSEDGIIYILTPKMTVENTDSEISQLAIKVRKKARKLQFGS